MYRSIDSPVAPGDETTFDYYSLASGKVACSICNRQGFGPITAQMRYHGHKPVKWQRVCLRGHAPCRKCGRMMALTPNSNVRGHSNCPGKQVWDNKTHKSKPPKQPSQMTLW